MTCCIHLFEGAFSKYISITSAVDFSTITSKAAKFDKIQEFNKNNQINPISDVFLGKSRGKNMKIHLIK